MFTRRYSCDIYINTNAIEDSNVRWACNNIICNYCNGGENSNVQSYVHTNVYFACSVSVCGLLVVNIPSILHNFYVHS